MVRDISGVPKLADTTVGKDKLAALKKIDDDKRATEQARNNLESFVINMKDVLEEDGQFHSHFFFWSLGG